MVSAIVCLVILVAAIFGVIVGVRRGLIWALLSLSLAWVVLIAVLAYGWPALGGRYEVGYKLRDNLPAWEKEWKFSEPLKRPLYEIIHSPSDEKLPVTFVSFREYHRLPPWTNHVNAHNRRLEYEYPDGSTLLLPADLTENDRKYLMEEFWNQRWGRWMVRLKPWFGAAATIPLILFCVLIPIWVMRRFGVAPR
jgi:hypothetical protein